MPVSRRPFGWTGWYRQPGGPWQPLVSADTEAAAWHALLAASARAGFSGDLVVLPAGKWP